jgi:hypothetical protein
MAWRAATCRRIVGGLDHLAAGSHRNPDRVQSLGAFACTGGIRHGLRDRNLGAEDGGKGLALPRDTIADRVDLKSVEPGCGLVHCQSGKTSVAALERTADVREFEFVADPAAHPLSYARVPRRVSDHTVEHYRAARPSRYRTANSSFTTACHNITDAVPDECA